MKQGDTNQFTSLDVPEIIRLCKKCDIQTKLQGGKVIIDEGSLANLQHITSEAFLYFESRKFKPTEDQKKQLVEAFTGLQAKLEECMEGSGSLLWKSLKKGNQGERAVNVGGTLFFTGVTAGSAHIIHQIEQHAINASGSELGIAITICAIAVISLMAFSYMLAKDEVKNYRAQDDVVNDAIKDYVEKIEALSERASGKWVKAVEQERSEVDHALPRRR